MRLCRALTNVLLVIYLISLALFLVAVLELFGVEGDAMSSVFLLMLGQPWIRFADYAPEALWPWLLALLPLVNIALLRLLCTLVFGRSRDS